MSVHPLRLHHNGWLPLLSSQPAPLATPSLLCSTTAEGFDATFGKPRDRLLVLERRRPARVISGEGRLMPLVRGGSTKQARTGLSGHCIVLL